MNKAFVKIVLSFIFLTTFLHSKERFVCEDLLDISVDAIPRIFEIKKSTSLINAPKTTFEAIESLSSDLKRFEKLFNEPTPKDHQKIIRMCSAWLQRRDERRQLTHAFYKEKYGLSDELDSIFIQKESNDTPFVLREYGLCHMKGGVLQESPSSMMAATSFPYVFNAPSVFHLMNITAIKETGFFSMLGFNRLIYLNVLESFKICALQCFFDCFMKNSLKKTKAKAKFKKWKEDASTMSKDELVEKLQKKRNILIDFNIFDGILAGMMNYERLKTGEICQFAMLAPLMHYLCEFIPLKRFISLKKDTQTPIEQLKIYYLYWSMQEDFRRKMRKFFFSNVLLPFPIVMGVKQGENRYPMQLMRSIFSDEMQNLLLCETKNFTTLSLSLKYPHIKVPPQIQTTLLNLLQFSVAPTFISMVQADHNLLIEIKQDPLDMSYQAVFDNDSDDLNEDLINPKTYRLRSENNTKVASSKTKSNQSLTLLYNSEHEKKLFENVQKIQSFIPLPSIKEEEGQKILETLDLKSDRLQEDKKQPRRTITKKGIEKAFLRMNEKGYEKIFFMQNIYPHYNALLSLLRDGVIADVWLRP